MLSEAAELEAAKHQAEQDQVDFILLYFVVFILFYQAKQDQVKYKKT